MENITVWKQADLDNKVIYKWERLKTITILRLEVEACRAQIPFNRDRRIEWKLKLLLYLLKITFLSGFHPDMDLFLQI